MEFKSKNKYSDMVRAYQKLEKINEKKTGTVSGAEAKDTTEEFFSRCYHLKDWLKKEYPNKSNEIEDYINLSPNLSLAGDYTNSFKHGGLDKPPRSGKNIESINTFFDLIIGGNGPRGVSSLLEITIDSQKYNSLDLAKKCIKEWDNFLNLHNIDLKK